MHTHSIIRPIDLAGQPRQLHIDENGNLYLSLTDEAGNKLVYGPRVQTPEGNVIQVQIGPGDPISNIPVFIDFPHHQIHEGESYLMAYYSTALGTLDFLCKVPANIHPHLLIEFSADQRVICTVYKTPTTTGDGTAQTSVNRNHSSTNIAGTIFYLAPTVTTPGTDVKDRYMVGSGEKAGGLARSDNEMILQPSTNYLIRFSGSNWIGNIRMLWYEDLGV
jgi:hypothetical protein